MAKISWESERELEDWIYVNSNKYGLNAITDEHINSIYRQVDFGSYGIADLVTFSYDDMGGLDVTIIEVKKEYVDVKTFAQLARYSKAFSIYMHEKLPNQPYSLNLIAVSTFINQADDSIWLSDLLTENAAFSTYTCNVDLENGITFEKSKGWRKIGEEFGKFHSSIGVAESISAEEYLVLPSTPNPEIEPETPETFQVVQGSGD